MTTVATIILFQDFFFFLKRRFHSVSALMLHYVMYIKVLSKLGWKAASLLITLSESSISGTSGTLLFSLSPAMTHRNSQSLLRPMFIPDLPRLELLCPVSSRQKLKLRLMLKILSPCHKGLSVIYWLPHAYGYFSCQTRYWLTYFPHYVIQMNCRFFFARGEAEREDTQSIIPSQQMWQSITHQLFLLTH